MVVLGRPPDAPRASYPYRVSLSLRGMSLRHRPPDFHGNLRARLRRRWVPRRRRPARLAARPVTSSQPRGQQSQPCRGNPKGAGNIPGHLLKALLEIFRNG